MNNYIILLYMWLLLLTIGILFFVSGQIILKLNTDNIILTSSCFFISSGILGLCLLLFYNKKHFPKIQFSKLGLLAGILFFVGNFLWINSIKQAPSLSMVRIYMAGIETILLVLLGFIIFQEKIKPVNIIGFCIVIIGLILSLYK